MTGINITVLCFMLSGSQEGIVLDPETLLSSSIQVKEDIKTCYVDLPAFQLKKAFLPDVFEDNLYFIFFTEEKKMCHTYRESIFVASFMLHYKNTLKLSYLFNQQQK